MDCKLILYKSASRANEWYSYITGFVSFEVFVFDYENSENW